METVTVLGDNAEDILYASISEGNLTLSFEYYATEADPQDYEFIFTVKPIDFPQLCEVLQVEISTDILKTIQEISDVGKGQLLKDALNAELIPRELFTWMS